MFYRYFYDQNEAIANGSASGKYFTFNTLGLINALIDESIQAPYYPLFANKNTYGIKAVNDTVFDYMTFACYMSNGCLDQLQYCKQTNRTSAADQAICSGAQSMCRDNVEAPYYSYSGRGIYDVRHPLDDPTPPDYFREFLNLASTQEAIGVNTNYTQFSNYEIFYAFQRTGDFVYPIFLEDLQVLLDSPVRIALIYGDAGKSASPVSALHVSSNASRRLHLQLVRRRGRQPGSQFLWCRGVPSCRLHAHDRRWGRVRRDTRIRQF